MTRVLVPAVRQARTAAPTKNRGLSDLAATVAVYQAGQEAWLWCGP